MVNNIQLPSWIGKPELSWQVLLGTIIVLAVVAFLSGFSGARKASKLAPVETLSFKSLGLVMNIAFGMILKSYIRKSAYF